MKEILFNLIRKHNYDISIYSSEIFERRCQEEIIRSDEDKTSFVYVEFDLEAVKSKLQSEECTLLFWEIFLAALNKSCRADDVLGMLENDSGIGMLILDSKEDGWNRIKGRIHQAAQTQGYLLMDQILNLAHPIVYPSCIQNSNLDSASAKQ